MSEAGERQQVKLRFKHYPKYLNLIVNFAILVGPCLGNAHFTCSFSTRYCMDSPSAT